MGLDEIIKGLKCQARRSAAGGSLRGGFSEAFSGLLPCCTYAENESASGRLEIDVDRSPNQAEVQPRLAYFNQS